jgi:uncharacterized phage-associated protein
MGYPAKAAANAFVDIAAEHNQQLSPLKLQKLMFLAHGWHLAIANSPLIEDEFAEAWQYGPVFPSVYHEFKEFGSGAIENKAADFRFAGNNNTEVEIFTPEIPKSDENTWKLIKKVWEVYSKYSGLGLSDLTHQAGTPWEKTWSASNGRKNADISNDLISAYYKALVVKNRKVEA